MSAENKLTKVQVLGQLCVDLVLKGEKLIKDGHPKAADSLFKMAADVVARTPKEEALKPTSS